MKKMRKLSFALAAAMTLTMGSAGMSASADDMVTVKAVFPSIYDTTDAPLVQDAINEILAEKYGIQMQMTFVSIGSWTQQTNLLLTGNDVDVLAFWTLPFATYVSNKQMLPLDDYLANADQALLDLFTEDQWAACQVDGVQYSIPNLRNYGNDMILAVKEGVLAELGLTTDDIKTLEDVDAFLYAAQEKYPDMPCILVPQSSDTMINGWTWDGLGDQNNVGVIGDCGSGTEVTDIFELEDYVEFCTYTNKWYNDGLTMGDVLNNQDTGQSLVTNGKGLAYFSNSGPGETAGFEKCVLVSNWSDSVNVNTLTYGINALSSCPDESFTLLQALYLDSDVQNLLINGIEGTHYVMNDDGSCSYPDGVDAMTSTYGIAVQYWAMPYAGDIPANMAIGNSATFYEDLRAFNADTRVSAATGFTYDSESVSDQYTACLNVIDKYYKGLLAGVLAPEDVLESAHQEMLDAGFADIQAAKQAGLDAVLAQN